MEERATSYRALIAKKIRGLMGEERVTQRDLGQALGYTQQSASKRISGKVPFTTDELEIIADYFDVPITNLLPPRPVRSKDNFRTGSTSTPATDEVQAGEVVELDAEDFPLAV